MKRDECTLDAFILHPSSILRRPSRTLSTRASVWHQVCVRSLPCDVLLERSRPTGVCRYRSLRNASVRSNVSMTTGWGVLNSPSHIFVSPRPGCLCPGIFTRKGLQPLQFNWILEKGGFLSHGNGSFLVDRSPTNLPTISSDMCATSQFSLLAVVFLQKSLRYGEEV